MEAKNRVRMLRKTSDGSVYPYTDKLAERADMQVVMADPANLKDYEIVDTGSVSDLDKLRAENAALKEENALLHAQVESLKRQLTSQLEAAVGAPDAGPGADATGEGGEAAGDVAEPPAVDLEAFEQTLAEMSVKEIEEFMRHWTPPLEVDRRARKDNIVREALAHARAHPQGGPQPTAE